MEGAIFRYSIENPLGGIPYGAFLFLQDERWGCLSLASSFLSSLFPRVASSQEGEEGYRFGEWTRDRSTRRFWVPHPFAFQGVRTFSCNL
jgi:hypothetical protein